MDGFAHTFEILVYLLVCEPQLFYLKHLKVCCPYPVVSGLTWRCVGVSIKFYAEPSFPAEEIYDIRVYDLLRNERCWVVPQKAKPEPLFGVRHGISHG